ncbi:MAG: protein kinase family protein [Planctomycetaceae bacterium]
MLGTPSYMAPEQAQGKTREIGPLTDVYALGAVLYCLVTGRAPFRAETAIETLRQVTTNEPTSPRLVNSAVDKDLETIILKCLQKDPLKRYASAAELAEDLGRFLDRRPIDARPVGATERAWCWCRRNPAVASLVAAVLVLLPAGAITSTWFAVKANWEAEQRKSAEMLRQVNEFYAGVSQVREAAANPTLGWTWKATNELRKAAMLKVESERSEELPILAADLAQRPDLRRVATFGEKIIVGALAFSPDGTRLAIGERLNGIGCTVEIWSVAGRERLRKLTFPTLGTNIRHLVQGQWVRNLDSVEILAWSPDGRWLVGGTRWGKLGRWDMDHARTTATVWDAHEEGIHNLGYSPDGRTIYSSAQRLKRWDVADNWKEIPTPDNLYKQFSISPDRGWLAVSDWTGTDKPGQLTMLDSKLNVIPSWPAGLQGEYPAFSPDGRFVALSHRSSIYLREARTGAEIFSWDLKDMEGHFYLREGLKFSADGSTLVGLDDRWRLHFWSVGSGLETMPALTSAADDPTFAVNPNGGWLAFASAEGSRHTALYEWKQPSASFTLPQIGTVRGLDFSLDGQSLVVATNTVLPERSQQWSQCVEWNIAARKLVKETRVTYRDSRNVGELSMTACHPNGDRIAWYTERCGVMVSPAHGHSGHAGIVHYPGMSAPVEIEPARFARCERSHGATIRHDPTATGEQAAVVEGDAAPGDRILALPLKEVPLEKTADTEGAFVIASAKVPETQPLGAILEFGSFNAGPNGKISKGEARIAEIADGDFHWYALDSFRKEEPDRGMKYVYLKTHSENGPSTSLILNRVLMVPLEKEGSRPEVPNWMLPVLMGTALPLPKQTSGSELPLVCCNRHHR